MVVTTCLISIMIAVIASKVINATSFITAVAAAFLRDVLESLVTNFGAVVLLTTSKAFLLAEVTVAVTEITTRGISSGLLHKTKGEDDQRKEDNGKGRLHFLACCCCVCYRSPVD